jgi:hypothetical protein
MPPNPEDSRTDAEDYPEDGAAHPEESGQIPRMRRRYNLSQEGRERLSQLGRARWAAEADAEERADELAERERRLQAAEAKPESERLTRVIRREIEALPEIEDEGLVRVSGKDYRMTSENGLVHVYWPDGPKSDLGEGQTFQFGGRAYCVRESRLRKVSPESILSRLLPRED